MVIVGFGPTGQVLANMLESPLAQDGLKEQLHYVVFDLDATRAQASRQAGMAVLFGDGSRTSVLTAAGITAPRAFVVCYTSQAQVVEAVEAIRTNYPTEPIYACAANFRYGTGSEPKGPAPGSLAPSAAAAVPACVPCAASSQPL